MLILTRKPGESIYIGDQIKVTIVELKGHQIRVGIDAPSELRIYREEIYLQILEENKQAAESSHIDALGLDALSAHWHGEGGEGSEGKKRKGLGAQSIKLTQLDSPPKAKDPEVLVRRKKGKSQDE